MSLVLTTVCSPHCTTGDALVVVVGIIAAVVVVLTWFRAMGD